MLLWCSAVGALEFETESVELTAAFGEQKLAASFPFINTGTTTVTVVDVRSGCGCTVPELAQKVYAPGEGGVIDVGYTVGHRQGLQRQIVRVDTDAGEHLLRLSVDVPVRLKMTPRLLLFRAAQAEEQTVKLEYREDVPVKIEKIENNNPGFSVELEMVEEGTDYQLKVQPNSDATGEARVLLRIHSVGESGTKYVDNMHIRRSVLP